MRTLLDNSVFVHNHYQIGFAHGWKSVRNDNGCSIFTKFVKRRLQMRFGHVIESACRFVQYKYRWIF